jgi:SOS-response transcriptional repressor LexA
VGKASQFVAADEEGEATFFLLVRGEDVGGFHDGDLLAISVVADAEPGDLVVWWYGASRTQALARVADDLSLRPLPGFPSPRNTAPCADAIGPPSSIRGVVVGFLRQMQP